MGLESFRIINPKFNPGLYGSLETADQVQRAIEDLYGAIPQTSEYRLQEAQDRSVSESIAMNGTLFFSTRTVWTKKQKESLRTLKQ
jgi:hypothetical protein